MTNRTPAFYNPLTRGWVVLDGNNIDHHDYHCLDLPDDGTYVFMFLIQVSKASTTKNVNIKVSWLNDRLDFFSNSKYHTCLFKQLPDSSTDLSELKNLDFKLAPFIVHSQCNPIDGPGNSLFNTRDVLNDYQTELPSINLVNELKPDLDYEVKKHWYTDWAYDIEMTERAEKEDQLTYAVSYRPPFYVYNRRGDQDRDCLYSHELSRKLLAERGDDDEYLRHRALYMDDPNNDLLTKMLRDIVVTELTYIQDRWNTFVLNHEYESQEVTNLFKCPNKLQISLYAHNGRGYNHLFLRKCVDDGLTDKPWKAGRIMGH